MSNHVRALVWLMSFFAAVSAQGQPPEVAPQGTVTEIVKQARKLVASDTTTLDSLGNAGALEGDVAIVGALFDDDAGQLAGSAYVFERNFVGENRWGEIKKLTASDAAEGDVFGNVVSISADIAIVGAHGNDDVGLGGGAVYVFQQDLGGPGNWGERKRLTASTVGSHGFGFSVAIDGDTLVVGAAFDQQIGSLGGAVFIFERNLGGANNWGERAKIVASDATSGDEFGYSVAIDGDTIIVGSSRAKACYVLERDLGGPDNWGESAILTISDGTVSDRFGVSVAVSGDTAVVAAAGADGISLATGAAYVFERDLGGANNWGERRKLLASDAETDDQFGSAVAVDGTMIVVGARNKSDAGPETGAAYAFEQDLGGPGSWGELDKILAIDRLNGESFGSAVAIGGNTVLVGARTGDTATGGHNAGAAYIFERHTLLFDGDFESGDCSAWDTVLGNC